MSWEAYRWTAKAPSELYQTLGPQGVDHLVRQMLDACWREAPEATRTLAQVKRMAQEVFERNMAAWSKIRQPTPTAFFEDLLPRPADQFFRQAMVLCWMMMPRAGGRDVSAVRKIVGAIYQRNLDAWDADEATFTGRKRPAATRRAGKKPAKKAPAARAARSAKPARSPKK